MSGTPCEAYEADTYGECVVCGYGPEAHGPWSAPESETERPETNIHPSEGATLPPSHVGGQRQAGRPTDTPDMVGSAAAGGPTPETEDGECIADRDAVAEIEADLHRMEVEISGSDPRFVSNEVRAITRHCRTLLALLRPEGRRVMATEDNPHGIGELFIHRGYLKSPDLESPTHGSRDVHVYRSPEGLDYEREMVPLRVVPEGETAHDLDRDRATDEEVAGVASSPIDDIARDLYYRSHEYPFTGAIEHIERVLKAFCPEGQEPVAWEARWRTLTSEAGHLALSMFNDDRPFGERLLSLMAKCEEKHPLASPPAPSGAMRWAKDVLAIIEADEGWDHEMSDGERLDEARRSILRVIRDLDAPPAPEAEGVPLWMTRGLMYVSRALDSREGNEAVKRETGGSAPEFAQGILDAIDRLWAAPEARPEGEGFSVTMVDLESGAEVQIEPSGCEREFFLAGNGSSLVLTPLAVPAEGERPTPEKLREWADWFDDPTVVGGVCWEQAPNNLYTAGFLLRRIADEFAAISHPDTQED